MRSCVINLPDYASNKNNGFPLEKVGIKNVEAHMQDFDDERVLTRQSIYIPLVGKQGVHMSRMVEVINSLQGLKIECDDSILYRIADSHNSDTAYWTTSWRSHFNEDKENDFFFDLELEGILYNDSTEWYITFTVPYASVCPCSHEMVKANGSGVPHMQRAEATVTGLIDEGENLDELIAAAVARVCQAVDLTPESLMKRNDELSWCVRAGTVNLFVEDAARLTGQAVEGIFNDWVVVCEHQESIHQHNVVAVCRKGDSLL
jgi:GTP cyclohydrolase FolE2